MPGCCRVAEPRRDVQGCRGDGGCHSPREGGPGVPSLWGRGRGSHGVLGGFLLPVQPLSKSLPSLTPAFLICKVDTAPGLAGLGSRARIIPALLAAVWTLPLPPGAVWTLTWWELCWGRPQPGCTSREKTSRVGLPPPGPCEPRARVPAALLTSRFPHLQTGREVVPASCPPCQVE